MRECETKIFFWGCGLNPSLYGIKSLCLSVVRVHFSKAMDEQLWVTHEKQVTCLQPGSGVTCG